MSDVRETARVGGRRRRSWSEDQKQQIILESQAAGASIAEVARRHDINANLLFTWRRQRGVDLDQSAHQELVPVSIRPEKGSSAATAGDDERLGGGRIEIVLSAGDRIVVGGDVDGAALSRVLKALARR